MLIVIVFIIDKRRFVDDHTSRQAQKVIHLSHPASVTLRQIIVDGHHVNTLAFQRVEIGRQRRHQGFTFTSLHLSHVTLVERHTTDQLNIIRTLTDDTLGRLTRHCKGIWQNRIQRYILLRQPFFQRFCLRLQFLI